jgi:hypothetical protein
VKSDCAIHHQSTGVSWNILDTTLGSDPIAQVKGRSLNVLVEALQIIVGRLDDYPNESEFRIGQLAAVNSEIELAERVCARLGKAVRALTGRRAGKQAFAIVDEYDVQDILHSLLRAYFKYPVKENPVSKVAGAASGRADLSIVFSRQVVHGKDISIGNGRCVLARSRPAGQSNRRRDLQGYVA